MSGRVGRMPLIKLLLFKATPRAAQLSEVPIIAKACRVQPNNLLWSSLCVIAALTMIFLLALSHHRKKQLIQLKKKASPPLMSSLDVAETPYTEDVLSAAVTELPSPVLESDKEPALYLPEQKPMHIPTDVRTVVEEDSTLLLALRARAADASSQATNAIATPQPSTSASPFSLDSIDDLKACEIEDMLSLSACLASELEKAKIALACKRTLTAAPFTAALPLCEGQQAPSAFPGAEASEVPQGAAEMPVNAEDDVSPLEASMGPNEESSCAHTSQKCSPPVGCVRPTFGRREATGLALAVAGSAALLAVSCLRRGR